MSSKEQTFQQMLSAISAFHQKFDFAQKGGEEPLFRMALMQEELGEICECITKGKSKEKLEEEHADLLILLLGNAISFNIDLEGAFWKKMARIMARESRIIDGRIRVSESFDEPEV